MKKKALKKWLGLFSLALISTMAMATFTSCDLSSLGLVGENSEAPAADDADDPNATHYTVTLDPCGGKFPSGKSNVREISVQEGKPINFTKYSVTMEGKTLLGWYTEDGKPWPGNRRVTGDVKLKAKWSITEEVETYDLTMKFDGQDVRVLYEDGAYQFSYTGEIFGGYTKRPALYTIQEEAFKTAIANDAGTEGVVLYRAESNYVEATGGEVYALFFNDGTVELYYKFLYQSTWTNYNMKMGTWALEGYTPPMETPTDIIKNEIFGETGGSVHGNWKNPYKKEDAPVEQAEVIYEVADAESPMYVLQFLSDKTYKFVMNYEYGETKGSLDVVTGAWSNDGEFELMGVTPKETNGTNYTYELSGEVDQMGTVTATFVVDTTALSQAK